MVLVHELEPLVAGKYARIKSVRNCLFRLFKQKMNCFDELDFFFFNELVHVMPAVFKRKALQAFFNLL